MLRNTVLSSCRVLIVIWQLKSLKFQSKKNYFRTHPATFVCLPYLLEKGQVPPKRFTSYYSIETSVLCVKSSDFIFQHGKDFIEVNAANLSY